MAPAPSLLDNKVIRHTLPDALPYSKLQHGRDHSQELRTIFSIIDADQTGRITVENLKVEVLGGESILGISGIPGVAATQADGPFPSRRGGGGENSGCSG